MSFKLSAQSSPRSAQRSQRLGQTGLSQQRLGLQTRMRYRGKALFLPFNSCNRRCDMEHAIVAALRKALKGHVNGDPRLNQTSAWPIYMNTGKDRVIFREMAILTSAALHARDRDIGLGALVWQMQRQPSFSVSDRSCLVAKERRTDYEQNSKTEDEGRMRAAWRKREREQKRGQRLTKRMLPIWIVRLGASGADRMQPRIEGHEEIIK